jgi:hypothetical protein
MRKLLQQQELKFKNLNPNVIAPTKIISD